MWLREQEVEKEKKKIAELQKQIQLQELEEKKVAGSLFVGDDDLNNVAFCTIIYK